LLRRGKGGGWLTTAAATVSAALQQAARLHQAVGVEQADAHAVTAQAQSRVQDATVGAGGGRQEGVDGEVDVLQAQDAERGGVAHVACSTDEVGYYWQGLCGTSVVDSCDLVIPAVI